MNYRKSWLAAIGLSGLMLMSFTAHARYYPDPHGVKISVVGDNGRVFPIHEGDKGRQGNTYRAYVEAINGKQYSIRVSNNTSDRVGVVLAVDGRNIISGKPSHLKRNERMYILKPYEQATYSGWRTSQHDIHRFYFTESGDSYAAAWGDRSAMGVIAAAVYREKKRYYDAPAEFRSRNKRGMDSATGRSARKQSQPGTGFGEHENSKAIKVHFEAERNPLAKVFYKYEWRSTLCKHGVISCRPKNRFWPDDNDEYNGKHLGFVPYPPGYDNYGHRDRNWK